jgi:hypothetical protein
MLTLVRARLCAYCDPIVQLTLELQAMLAATDLTAEQRAELSAIVAANRTAKLGEVSQQLQRRTGVTAMGLRSSRRTVRRAATVKPMRIVAWR